MSFRVDREAVLEAIERLKKYPGPVEVAPPASTLVEFATRLLDLREQAVLDGGLEDHLLEPVDAALAAVTSTFFALAETELKRFHGAANAPISGLITALRVLQAGTGGDDVDWFEAWLREHFPKAESIFDLAVSRFNYEAMARWCFVRPSGPPT